MTRNKKTNNNKRYVESDDEDQSYSNIGIQVKTTFTHEDFLSNPETRIMLERDFHERMTKRIEAEVTEFYEGLRKHECDVASGMFAHDKGGEGIGILMSILVDNIKKDYRFEMFYERPELATPLLIEYEIAN
jgi:hypothetical protein